MLLIVPPRMTGLASIMYLEEVMYGVLEDPTLAFLERFKTSNL